MLIRQLCENPFEGGAGYTPQQVAAMTPDQIYFRLVEKGVFKEKVVEKVSLKLAGSLMDNQGRIKARDAQGNLITLRASGKSKVQMIREQKAKAAADREKVNRKRDRRRKASS